MWVILFIAIVLAVLIWWHFNTRIEKLRTGLLIEILAPVDAANPYFFYKI